MRPSMAYSRVSYLPSSVSSAAAVAKLAEKKKEFDAVSALERASTQYLERIMELADDCEVMADAGQVHGQVLAQWPKMFEILSQFLSARQQLQEEGATETSIMGERLVRLPIEELKANSTSS
ncbi:hypothetical protein CC1G_14205 [Coprinopsis cinerea okayama7|uniref:DASH complex subunit DAD2 n=1 Tax=Coprinopsis cinerea (strain Okayama-7 / 130 / ATCC MYA-4618 / FGSC 9003) TaxID=240176 RepID=D6RLN4_COPC7|nr:hypothetical protein CC1G_14205 [Coprinopsis cinerea okayama7\|eukprot:XP_002911672.1 hypothetical protein CC1G_14205 [Coprinopsis cinerea okayama7\